MESYIERRDKLFIAQRKCSDEKKAIEIVMPSTCFNTSNGFYGKDSIIEKNAFLFSGILRQPFGEQQIIELFNRIIAWNKLNGENEKEEAELNELNLGLARVMSKRYT